MIMSWPYLAPWTLTIVVLASEFLRFFQVRRIRFLFHDEGKWTQAKEVDKYDCLLSKIFILGIAACVLSCAVSITRFCCNLALPRRAGDQNWNSPVLLISSLFEHKTGKLDCTLPFSQACNQSNIATDIWNWWKRGKYIYRCKGQCRKSALESLKVKGFVFFFCWIWNV